MGDVTAQIYLDEMSLRVPMKRVQAERVSYCSATIRWVAISLATLAMIGCHSAPPSYSSDYKAKFEKRVGADEAKARAFVTSIAGIPAGERADYVRQHPPDAKNLARIPDQALQTRYKSLMLERK